MAEKKSAKNETKPAKKNQAKQPNPVVKYFKDLRSEFKKVVWPSRKTVINNTGVVLSTVVVSGLAIFALDALFTWLLQLLLAQAG